MDEVSEVLIAYGFGRKLTTVVPFGDGLINKTYLIEVDDSSGHIPRMERYVLQHINDKVFSDPVLIDNNLAVISDFLKVKNSSYTFVAPKPVSSGSSTMVRTINNQYYRLFDFIPGSRSYNTLNDPALAYEAAAQFGLFTANLQELDVGKLRVTILDFHNLSLRYANYWRALNSCRNPIRLQQSQAAIQMVTTLGPSVVDVYEKYLRTNTGVGIGSCGTTGSETDYDSGGAGDGFVLRVTHHDTKINNVLFDVNTHRALCVVDLDTVMPGYFISDLGDMCRTYLCCCGEEDAAAPLANIQIRIEYYQAIIQGYLLHMYPLLTRIERQYIVYAGKFSIFMQAIRFLSDYLEEDVYYKVQYPEHNLQRAMHQLTLLERYIECESSLQGVVDEVVKTF